MNDAIDLNNYRIGFIDSHGMRFKQRTTCECSWDAVTKTWDANPDCFAYIYAVADDRFCTNLFAYDHRHGIIEVMHHVDSLHVWPATREPMAYLFEKRSGYDNSEPMRIIAADKINDYLTFCDGDIYAVFEDGSLECVYCN